MKAEAATKVIFICPNLKAGGAERQWALLVPGLSERGFDVSVLTLDGRGVYFDELRARGVSIACAGLRHRADPVGLARAVQLSGARSSVVVTRGVSAHLFGHVLARRQHAAHVVTEHLGDDPLGLRPLRPHQRLLLGPIRPRANAVVAVTASQREQLVRDGYRPDAIRVIPSGVADDPPVREREAVRQELGVGRSAFLAVLVAALRPEKCAAVFVEQVTAAHAVERSIQGLVVGDGPDVASVARAVARSNGAVRMLGFRSDAVDIMHAADVVCLTSAVEGLPISVLEAMSVARPVVAPRVGGLPEVVEDGETGVLISRDHPAEMARALVDLARNPGRGENLGRAGRARQQRAFSSDAMTRAYADLLSDVNRPAARASKHNTTANGRPDAVRVAVQVESLIVPKWVEWAIARIDAADGLDLVAVVPTAGARRARAVDRELRDPRDLIYRLYESVDRMVFGAAPAMRDTDLSPISSGRNTFAGIGEPDVVVSFLPADRAAWHGPTPRYGVWAIAPMDDGRPTGAPARFWEVHGRGGTATAAVVALQDGLTRVIAEESTRADPLSLTRTRDAAAWTSARLVLRCLRLLRRDGAPRPARGGPREPRQLPPPAVTVSHAASTAVRGVAAKTRKAWYRDEWFVAVRARSANARAHPARALPNPPGRYLGDPFPIEVDGRHFLFVEDYSYAARRGAIAVSEAGPNDAWSPPRTVLERDHHLSYPFVFEHDGAIYMLPETGETGRVELHRAVRFPDEWRLDRVLLDGLTAVDATLHFEGGLVWLFANVMEGRQDRGHLWLFFSPSLDGEWRPHPRNPIVTDPGTARPAGRLFRREGALIRPSQDCLRGYGRAVVLNRVDVLSPSEYRETPFGRIEPTWLGGLQGTHTYTFDSRYEYLDGYRWVRRLRGGRRASSGAAAICR